MFNSASPGATSSIPKAPPPGSIPQPSDNGLPGEMVPDWNNIGLFTAGIAVGAILGAAVALLFAPASGGETRHRIARRVKNIRDEDDIWDELAQELELAAADQEREQEEELETARETLKTAREAVKT
jgi:gas vesicle protein